LNQTLLASRDLEEESLRQHVKELLGWLGEHPTRPSFVHQFFRDADTINHGYEWLARHLPSRNPKRKMRSAAYAVMAVNRLQRNARLALHRKNLEIRVKDRLDWLAMHVPEPHPHHAHYVQFDLHDEATVPAGYHQDHDKNFERKRKVLGDTVIVPHAGMLPEHELRKAYSVE
jgi:hypothetical protein